MTSILNMSAGLMIFMYILSCIIIAIFTAWIASQKSRSALLWFFLGFFFGFIALLAVGLAPKNGENTTGYLVEQEKEDDDQRKCPYCAEMIKKEALICRYCGKDLQEYEKNRIKQEEEEKQKIKEKFNTLNDIFGDQKIMEEAKEMRRIYGKKMYIEFLNKKARELGIEGVMLTEDDIE